jgi:hypothetical protein
MFLLRYLYGCSVFLLNPVKYGWSIQSTYRQLESAVICRDGSTLRKTSGKHPCPYQTEVKKGAYQEKLRQLAYYVLGYL